MKIIDMLDRIAKGEESLLIKYRDKILHWNKEKDRFEDKYGMNTLYEMDFSELNDKVEVIEDKKIEKLKWVDYNVEFTREDMNIEFRNICNTIDKIIDYINGGTNGE